MDDAGSWFEKGMHHVEMSFSADYRSELIGDLEDAVAAFDQALALRPDHADALKERALALARLGRDEEAVAAFARALLARPGDPDLLLASVRSLSTLKRYDEALAACEEMLAKRPRDAEARYLRAGLLDSLAQTEQALIAWEQILGEPEAVSAGVLTGRFRHARARLARAADLARLGRNAEAVAAFRELLEHERLREVEHDFYAALGELEAAREAYWAYLESNSTVVLAWLRAGGAFSRAHRAADALKAYENAARLDPENADAWWGVAEALAQDGRSEQSIAMFDEALRIRPDYLGPKARRAAVLRQLALARDPDDSKRPGAIR